MPAKRTALPVAPATLVETIAAYDSAARDAAWKWRQQAFDHSARSVVMLEEMLEELYQELHRTTFRRRIGLGASEVDFEQWANLWGVYLGESLRERLGGEWMIDHPEAPHLLALQLPDGTVAFPTARVFRRLSDGAKESVVDYFEVVVREVEGDPYENGTGISPRPI